MPHCAVNCDCSLTLIPEYTGERVSTGDHVSDDPDMPQKLSTEAYEPNLPLGVIVGAVVGGVLAIALLSKAFLLLRRRAHRKRRAKRGFPEVRDEHEGF